MLVPTSIFRFFPQFLLSLSANGLPAMLLIVLTPDMLVRREQCIEIHLWK
jgi:hypothetical protein